MKKVLLVVVMLLLCTQTYAKDLSVWVWGEDVGVRVGYNIDPNTELGLSASWLSGSDDPETIGFFGIRHLPEIISIPNPLGDLEWLPATLSGHPYFGAKLERSLEEKENIFSLLAGVAINPFFIETSFLSDTPKFVTGVRFRF